MNDTVTTQQNQIQRVYERLALDARELHADIDYWMSQALHVYEDFIIFRRGNTVRAMTDPKLLSTELVWVANTVEEMHAWIDEWYEALYAEPEDLPMLEWSREDGADAAKKYKLRQYTREQGI